MILLNMEYVGDASYVTGPTADFFYEEWFNSETRSKNTPEDHFVWMQLDNFRYFLCPDPQVVCVDGQRYM